MLEKTIDIEGILKVLPHAYPFVFIDRVLEMEPGERVICLKNVTINEPFFQGHFPGHPVMPGVLLLEAMAQTGGVLVLYSYLEEYAGRNVYFMGIDRVRFRKIVRPGDQLRLEGWVTRRRGDVWKFKCQCTVEGQLAAEAELMAMVE